MLHRHPPAGPRADRGRAERVQLAPVEVSASELFAELYPGGRLPPFAWLQVGGVAGRDDFGMSPDHRLVVSDRALGVLRAGQLRHCEVSEWT